MAQYRLRFTRLSGTNVCSYPSFDIDLADQGTVLCTGVNGSGKSTPWYALTHLLYNFTTKGIKQRELVNIHDPRNYHCRVELELDGVPYAIEEFRDHRTEGTGRKIWRAGRELPTGGVRETLAEITRLIDLDQRSFLSNVFLSQEHTHILVDGRPKERQEHIMWLFGLNAFEDLSKLAKVETDKVKDQIADVERLKQEITDLKAQLKELPTRTYAKDELDKMRRERERLNKEIEVLEGRRSRISDRISKVEVRDELVRELRELAVEGSPTATDIEELQREVSDLADDLADTKSKLSLATKAATLREELERYGDLPPSKELRVELEKVQERKLRATEVELPEAERAHRLRQKLHKIRRDESDILDDLEHQEGEMEAKTKRMSRRVKEIRSQLKKGICPTCKRPWDLTEADIEELEHELADRVSKLDQANKDYYAMHARAEDARQVHTLNKRLSKLIDKDPQDIELEISGLAREERGLRQELTVSEEREDIRARLAEAPSEAPEKLRKRQRRLDRQLKEKRAEHRSAQQAHTLLRRISKLPTGDLRDLKAKLGDAEQALKDARSRITQLTEDISDLAADLKRVNQLTEDREHLEDKLEKSQHAMTDAKLWAAIRDGFGHLLRQRERKLLKRISKELPAYFNPLFGEQSQWVRAELCKEKSGGIDIQVLSKEIALPAKGPSPGQKTKLGISLLFSCRDLYAKNASNLIVLDEPLWRIDQESRPAFLVILDELRKRVETLVITTHEQEIKGHAFDRRWETTIHDGVSTLRC